jgi:hypothetical protein
VRSPRTRGASALAEGQKEYFINRPDADYSVRQETEVRDMMSIEALEAELAKYLDDFSQLQLSAKTESPR